jgi:DNA-binding transcriptional LysR family regulator
MTRTAFDVRLALCFAAVAEERSFTKAARRLGIAQPSVSDQVKRLEEQVRVPLLVRNSRKVELTSAGASFLTLVQRIALANDEAQEFAWTLRRRAGEVLRIGAPFYSADIMERTQLIGQFMAEASQFPLDIVHGWGSDLIAQLRRGEVDLALVQGEVDLSELQYIVVHRSHAHFLVPAESPLAAKEGVTVADLGGHAMVSTLPHVDPAIYDTFFKRFADGGVTLVPSPEQHPHTMDQFARARRLILLRFGRGRGHRRPDGDMVRIPSSEEPPIVSEMLLVRRPEPGAAALERFWALAVRLKDAAADSDGHA